MILPDKVYEAAPMVYAIVGLTSMFKVEPLLGRICGAMLVSAAMLIMHLRAKYRKGY